MFRIRSKDVTLVLAIVLVAVVALTMYLTLQGIPRVPEAEHTAYQSTQTACPTAQESLLSLIRRYVPLP